MRTRPKPHLWLEIRGIAIAIVVVAVGVWLTRNDPEMQRTLQEIWR